jgi:hypothetical protein
MLCSICKGSGSLISFNPREWWDCPKCGGAGVSFMSITPPTIQVSAAQMKKANKANKKPKWVDPNLKPKDC